MEYSRFRQRMEKQGKTGEYNGIIDLEMAYDIECIFKTY